MGAVSRPSLGEQPLTSCVRPSRERASGVNTPASLSPQLLISDHASCGLNQTQSQRAGAPGGGSFSQPPWVQGRVESGLGRANGKCPLHHHFLSLPNWLFFHHYLWVWYSWRLCTPFPCWRQSHLIHGFKYGCTDAVQAPATSSLLSSSICWMCLYEMTLSTPSILTHSNGASLSPINSRWPLPWVHVLLPDTWAGISLLIFISSLIPSQLATMSCEFHCWVLSVFLSSVPSLCPRLWVTCSLFLTLLFYPNFLASNL